MVRYFQESSSGHYRYSVWAVSDSAGKITCLAILCCQQNASQNSNYTQQGDPLKQVFDAALHQHPKVSRIQAVYVPPVDLQRYGEVDHLAPAGAMEEFVQHVQGQTLQEACHAFAPLRQPLHRLALALEISVASSLKKAKNLLSTMGMRALQ